MDEKGSKLSKQDASSEEKEVILSYLLPFLNLEKHFPLLPGKDNVEAHSLFMGIDEENLFSGRILIAEQIRMAVEDLKKDKDILKRIDKLPFKTGEKIVVIGDSITDDLSSWFFVLKHLIESVRPELKLKWVNRAKSYNTTTDMVRSINRDVLSEEPDWVFCAAGTMDMSRLKIAPERTIVPLADSWENFALVEDVTEKVTENPVIWISPAGVNESLQEDFDYFDFSIDNKDLSELREIIGGRRGIVVDPYAQRFEAQNEEEGKAQWFFKQDGVHHSAAGHTRTVHAFLHYVTKNMKAAKSSDDDGHNHDHDHDGNCNHDH